MKKMKSNSSGTLFAEASVKNSESVLYASLGQIKAMEELIATGCNVDSTDEFGTTAAIMAASRNDFRMLKLLVEKGNADLSKQNDFGKSALTWSLHHKNTEMQKYINSHLSNGSPAQNLK